jgi:hypothetical protein
MANISLASLKARVVQANFTDTTYTDQIYLDQAHIIAQDIWSDIIYVRKGNKNWDVWLADTVSLQNEYTRPTVTSTNVGADMIESVSIAYTDDTYTNTAGKVYIPCTQATQEQIKDWNRLLEEQDRDNPIYFYSDDSIFIAPEVRTTEAGVERLKITGVRSVASGSWTTATTETDIKLPVFMFEALFYGMMWKSSEHMRREDAIIMQKYNFYETFKARQIKKMNIETSESYDSHDLRNSTSDDFLE